MSSQPPALPREGTPIEGKYRLERFLKSGGMGAIALAEHLQLRQKVVLKFLLPSFANEADSVDRFIREAKHAAQVKSARAVRVLDVSSFEGTPYIVMEYLEGVDLAHELARRGTLPIEEAVDLLLATIEAIAVAHKLGIVHRDIKPANLFLVSESETVRGLKVLDFGIAKSMDPSHASLAGNTETHSMLGTPAYMSPEQLRSAKNVDERTDIWALGVVLYELIAGERPFAGGSPAEVCAGIFRDPPSPLRKRRPDVPQKLVQVIECCLEKDRDDRFRTVADLASALAPFAGSTGRQSLRAIEEIVGSVARPAERRPTLPLAALVGIGLLVPLGVLLLPVVLRPKPKESTASIASEAPADRAPVPRDEKITPIPANEQRPIPIDPSVLPSVSAVAISPSAWKSKGGSAAHPTPRASSAPSSRGPDGELFGTAR